MNKIRRLVQNLQRHRQYSYSVNAQ